VRSYSSPAALSAVPAVIELLDAHALVVLVEAQHLGDLVGDLQTRTTCMSSPDMLFRRFRIPPSAGGRVPTSIWKVGFA
jgi:hypothetical protein